MAVEIQSFKLPGRSRFTIPIVGTKTDNEISGISKSTYEWTIVFSAIADKAFELFGFSHGASRETIGHSVNQLFSGAATRLSDLTILVSLDESAPAFEQYMNDGTLFETITIRRHGWIQGANQVLEERVFSTCYIVRFLQILDYLALTVRTCDTEEIVNIYDQNGEAKGTAVSSMSMITGQSTHG